MKTTANEAVKLNGVRTDISNDFDGSLQKRSNIPRSYCAMAMSDDAGKVLDVEVHTEFFCGCTAANTQKTKADHQAKCVSNYEGTSGGMELAVAVIIVQCSQQGRGMCYLKCLGDGNSEAFISATHLHTTSVH
jgi:hypothetical protein